MTSRFSDLRATAHASALRACHMFAATPEKDLQIIAGFVRQRAVRKGEFVFRADRGDQCATHDAGAPSRGRRNR